MSAATSGHIFEAESKPERNAFPQQIISLEQKGDTQNISLCICAHGVTSLRLNTTQY